MKKLFVLAVASMFATTAMAAEMKWSGSAGWRYEQTTHNDGLGSKSTATVNAANTGSMAGKDVSKQTTRAHGVRANLGVTGGWENVESGVGVRPTNAANDDYVNLSSNADRTMGIEQAWFRYLHDFGSLNLAATIGRQKNVFLYDMDSQQLFDNDVRWDGFGWNFKAGMFGFNASQYILGARNRGTNGASTYTFTDSSQANAAATSKMYYMLGFQPYMNWKFSDDIDAMFAFGYYRWSDQQNTNTTNGGYNTATLNTGSSPVPVGAGSFNIHNPSQWQVLANVTLPSNLTFTGEIVKNKTKKALYNANFLGSTYTGGSNQPQVSSTAWSLGLKYGKVRKAHDFSVGYAYGKKGIASVIGAYSNDRFLPDNKGHTFHAAYALADNFNIGGRMMMLKEVEVRNATTGYPGYATTASGAATAQNMKTNYWELNAGVSF